MGLVDPHLAVFKAGFVHHGVAFAFEGVRRWADGGGGYQVEFAQGLALGGYVPELIGGGGPRDAGEVDFQEFGIGGAVGGTVQHAIDVVDHGHLIRGAVGWVLGEALQAFVEFGIKVDAAGLV